MADFLAFGSRPLFPLAAQVTVLTAGKQVPLSTSSLPVKSVTIKALASNIGVIYVGGAAVLNTGTNGFPLAATDTYSIDIADLTNVWINATVNGEGVTYGAVI